MTVDPTKSTPNSGIGPGRVDRPTRSTPEPRRAPDAVDVPSSGADAVELSEAARALLKQIGLDAPPISDLSPERMREVLDRLNAGHYDKPEVIAEVVRRLKQDL
ncbi:MAG: hypothetical protein AAB011_03990 [Candidatus Eisenbacteria bacterium]